MSEGGSFLLAKIDYSQLRATVKKRGLTLIELARKANISHSVLCRLSSNITDVVNIDLDDT